MKRYYFEQFMFYALLIAMPYLFFSKVFGGIAILTIAFGTPFAICIVALGISEYVDYLAKKRGTR